MIMNNHEYARILKVPVVARILPDNPRKTVTAFSKIFDRLVPTSIRTQV
jgi:hypothetical protein